MLKAESQSTREIKLTSFNIRYESLIIKKGNGSINLKLLARNSMKELKILDICIWKKVFQIDFVRNYFGRTSFQQIHIDQTTNRIKLVYFLNFP